MATSSRSGGQIEIVFGPDGHQSTFDLGWLGQFVPEDERELDRRSEDSKRLWSAADIQSAFPEGSWPLFQADVTHRQACLSAVIRDGFVVLREVPPEPGTVLTVARSFGLIREMTEHGSLVELRVTARPTNPLFTARGLDPRSGLVFRDPVPAVELAHCIRQSPDGGDSLIIDGFYAAATLRTEHPDAFDVLASTEVTFAYADATCDLRATKPVIGLGPRGRIRAIRFDRDLMQPVRMPAADVVAFYDAYRTFAEVIRRPGLTAAFTLRQGDCLVVDNTRILVGRTAFTGTERHMQLCWADLDTVASKLAVIRRAGQNGHGRY